MFLGMSCKHYLHHDLCQVCREPDLGTMSELNREGDTKYTWDRKSPKECEAAHEHFTAMRAKGFLIFKVKPFGRKSKQQVGDFNPKDGGYVYSEGRTKGSPYREPAEIAREFDPKADYVVTPAVAGG